jgi:serine/threonine-protein kinase
MAYADAEGGTYEVYVRAFPDKGARVRISNAGGMIPVWSRTRQELFYRTVDSSRIMVVNYTVKGDLFVPEKPRLWSGKQLANLGTGRNYDVAPDGRCIVLVPLDSPEPRETQSHVMLEMNFFDEVRRRVSGRPK